MYPSIRATVAVLSLAIPGCSRTEAEAHRALSEAPASRVVEATDAAAPPAVGPRLFDAARGPRTVEGLPPEPLDDRAMGGISAVTTRVEQVEGAVALLLRGSSAAGSFPFPFAGVRVPTRGDLRGARGIELRLRGDGKRYRLQLESAAVHDYDFHAIAFEAPRAWTTLRFDFDALTQRGFGAAVPRDEAAQAATGVAIVSDAPPKTDFGSIDLAIAHVALF